MQSGWEDVVRVCVSGGQAVVLNVDFMDSVVSFMGSKLTLTSLTLNCDSIEMEPNAPVRVHLVPFHCQS